MKLDKEQAPGSATADAFRKRWVRTASEAAARIWYGGDFEGFDEALEAEGVRTGERYFSKRVIATATDPGLIGSLLIGTARNAEAGNPQRGESTPTPPKRSEGRAQSEVRFPPGGMSPVKSAPTDDQIVSRLERIDRLLAQGVITQAEHDEKRREILADL
ncbi:SHOCT domain-containing protein [Actinomycetota bacterium]